MSAATLGALLLAGFVAVEGATTHAPGWRRRGPLLAFALLLGFGAIEIARYDHGHGDWLLGIGFVGAPPTPLPRSQSP